MILRVGIFLKSNILHSKHRRKNPQFIIYYNNDKCFLILVIYISLLCFTSYFFQKAENNSFYSLFLLKIGSVGPIDQQTNLVSPKLDFLWIFDNPLSKYLIYKSFLNAMATFRAIYQYPFNLFFGDFSVKITPSFVFKIWHNINFKFLLRQMMHAFSNCRQRKRCGKTKAQKTNINILRTKSAFFGKIKSVFAIFWKLSLGKI